jgi:pyruvate,water dikinase
LATLNYIRSFHEVGKDDIPLVGGKGANLGELTQKGIQVPPGFCVTATAYSYFIKERDLDKKINSIIDNIDYENTAELQIRAQQIRNLIERTEMVETVEEEITEAYAQFSRLVNITDPSVAVRSSATAEDLPEASFAGQQDTYLEISGVDEVIKHVKKCWASLWTARAIYYRENQGFSHFDVSLCTVIQKMVDSEKSGVLFTANPVTNNRNEIMINASWGLGEAVVSGLVTPDEYLVEKNTLKITEKQIAKKNVLVVKNKEGVGTIEVAVKDYLGYEQVSAQCLLDEEIDYLCKSSLKIEEIYQSPQDIEWALDRDTKELYILQARPVTTLKEVDGEMVEKIVKRLPLVRGLAASPGMAFGKVKKIKDITEISRVEKGDILVTEMTNPDMIPALKKAAAVVTDEGGRTCHAAIVSRELGIPCIVGSGTATEVLHDGMEVTVDATRGIVYSGNLMPKDAPKAATETHAQAQATINEALLAQLAPITGTKVYMNLGESSLIHKYKNLPFDGIGLMRTEFIFTTIGIHPMYLLKTGQGEKLVDAMVEAITTAAEVIYPRPLVVRLSDFRSNEFRGLEGGEEVEPVEANPMIGWRGVSRYISPEYEAGFRLECQAIKKVREEFGLSNVWVMLPFVRTPWEVVKVKQIMAEEGLVQNNEFKIWIMAEVPSVIFAAEEFAQLVDGFSIGSNDLTQLIMGADRDSGILNSMGYFDERSPSIKSAIKMLIGAAHKHGKTVSICGQGPSLYPEFTEFLVNEGIDSISVNPDTVAYTRRLIASVEQRIILTKIRNL